MTRCLITPMRAAVRVPIPAQWPAGENLFFPIGMHAKSAALWRHARIETICGLTAPAHMVWLNICARAMVLEQFVAGHRHAASLAKSPQSPDVPGFIATQPLGLGGDESLSRSVPACGGFLTFGERWKMAYHHAGAFCRVSVLSQSDLIKEKCARCAGATEYAADISSLPNLTTPYC